ncbi:phage tail assembly protein [Atopomonas sediminilitoris]|uniref:phage tail assembly protein n=1 Tax=Atopomonas sediminilitoris TaxID=2919919 RepID=UPI001F4D54E3|nr:phage tail assembly protein [Atopomonas sediminilitoris]MCJ8168631.1 phage tail assembly protein [Atopomonas sediminilitoris]
MSDLVSAKVITVAEREVVVRELKVADVRQMLACVSDDAVDSLLFEDLRLSDFPRMTSLTLEDVEQLRPSQLQYVLGACREMNPDFFEMLGRAKAATV